MSESKKKGDKKGKQIPAPLISDVKGVIKSFIAYEDDDCVNLSILIRRRRVSPRMPRYFKYDLIILMGTRESVYDRSGNLIELSTGASVKKKEQLIFNENQSIL